MREPKYSLLDKRHQYTLEKIKNNDIVVFNWPRDTLANMYLPATERIDKPRDKKTNYVKRCVGIAGDSLQIKDGIVFI